MNYGSLNSQYTSKGHTKLISCFWSYKSLKNGQATRLFFFLEINVERKWYTSLVEGEVWGQDYKMQTIVYLRSQNIEAWM